jgi:hypothetical protein
MYAYTYHAGWGKWTYLTHTGNFVETGLLSLYNTKMFIFQSQYVVIHECRGLVHSKWTNSTNSGYFVETGLLSLTYKTVFKHSM